jgi:surface carbohydrate biosynthesis protein (TIGR04326 family)
MGPAITGGLLPDGARPLAQRLWVRSYAGADLARGLYYAEVFRRMMPETTAAPTCVYQAEFQAWEHALNARAAERPAPLRTIGFQHTSVSRNYFFYFHQPSERTGPLPLPMPGTLAFSGALPERIVADCQYPSTRRVEAVRQFHLAGVLTAPVARDGTPLLLVAGSIDRAESRAILSLAAKAFPRAEGVRIALRSHPSQPLAPLCAELGLDIGAAGYETFSGTTDEALRAASLVLVGSSSLAVEALAYGCEVIAPVFASFLPLTPLSGFEEVYERVYSPAGLRAAVERFLSAGPAQSAAAKRDFVQQYWILDRSLAGWMALLDERSGDGPAPAAILPA